MFLSHFFLIEGIPLTPHEYPPVFSLSGLSARNVLVIPLVLGFQVGRQPAFFFFIFISDRRLFELSRVRHFGHIALFYIEVNPAELSSTKLEGLSLHFDSITTLV